MNIDQDNAKTRIAAHVYQNDDDTCSVQLTFTTAVWDRQTYSCEDHAVGAIKAAFDEKSVIIQTRPNKS